MKDFKGGAKKSGAFGKKSSFAPRGGFTKDRRGAFGGRGGRDAEKPAMYKATCGDCGAPCEVPFRPTAGKPVFCDACFHGSDSVHKPAKAKDDYREHLAALHAKLDHILSILKVNDAFVAQAEKIEKFEKKEIEPVIKKAKKLAEAKVKELEVGAKTLAKKAGKIEKEVKAKILKPAAAKIKKIKKKV